MEWMTEHWGGRWRLMCSQVRGDRVRGLFVRYDIGSDFVSCSLASVPVELVSEKIAVIPVSLSSLPPAPGVLYYYI